MKRNYFISLLLFISTYLGSCKSENPTGQSEAEITELPNTETELTAQEISNLDSLNINFQLRGWLYGFDSEGNGEASNGEAHSDNLAKSIPEDFPRNSLYMVINDHEYVEFDSSYLGSKLYLINTTTERLPFEASDSRLNIILSALDENNAWNPISYIPMSSCGNSFHIIELERNEYWEFEIPIFSGSFKTKIRYELEMLDSSKIISNEIDAFINPSQFNPKNKQGWNPINMMDPYQE